MNINGQELQHALVDLRMATAAGTDGGGGGAPIQVSTFSALSYSVEVKKHAERNDQGQIVRHVFDEQTIEASVEMLRSEWLTLRAQLLAGNPGLGILQVRMDWTVSYGASISNLTTDRLLGVMFERDPFESTSDQAALVVTIPLFVTDVLYNTGNGNGTPAMVYRPPSERRTNWRFS